MKQAILDASKMRVQKRSEDSTSATDDAGNGSAADASKPLVPKATAKSVSAGKRKRHDADTQCNGKAGEARPDEPKHESKTTFYNGGKILCSLSKQSWRVFAKTSDKVDKAIRWKGDSAAAWQLALDHIDAPPKSKPKTE